MAENDAGNTAVMRKALEELVKFTCDSCNERFCEDDVEEEDGIHHCSPCNAIIKARAALAATPRNCDVYDVEDGVTECMQAIDAAWHEIDTIRATIAWMLATAEGKETPNGL